MAQSGRLLSLDVMRGITIAGMIMVNNPGSWGYVYAPLRHASWNGLTPTDLVFPFFMFIMGVSMFFSLRKYDFKLSGESVTKVLKRTVLIFLVGFALNLFGHLCYNGFSNFENLRILGVMQRLALAYGIGSLIGLSVKHKYILQTAAGILLFYWILLAATGSQTLSEDNIIAIVDRALFGNTHMYHDYLADGTRIAFDPEGLLSCLGSIGHVLLGFYVGKMILDCKKNNELIIRNLFIFGTIIMFLGFLLSYGCPINKKLWSSTFVLTTCGFGVDSWRGRSGFFIPSVRQGRVCADDRAVAEQAAFVGVRLADGLPVVSGGYFSFERGGVPVYRPGGFGPGDG